MLFIIDARLPQAVQDRLSQYDSLLPLKTEGITYDAISGHPDIFIFQARDRLIVAPNLPDKFLCELRSRNIPFEKGRLPVGPEYPESARYNALITPSIFLHRLNITDPAVLDSVSALEKINTAQGYTRCNVVPLPNRTFITSDAGIHKILLKHGYQNLLYSGNGILLNGFQKGFIGGACGVDDTRLYVTGSLTDQDFGLSFRNFIKVSGLDLVELADSAPIDSGCILTIPD